METISCPWCGQRTLENAYDCRKCGGPLPPPIGDDPGPSPPLPPRKLPSGYKRRMIFTNDAISLVGIIFLCVGLPLGTVFTILGVVIPGMWLFTVIGGSIGGIFTLLGGAMAYFGIQNGLQKVSTFEHGQATIGEVVDMFIDRTISVNNRNPWRIIYTFDVHGRPYHGKALSWQHAPQTQAVGNRIYVLYMPDDPEQNVIYPPV